jgi:hypothetical protein
MLNAENAKCKVFGIFVGFNLRLIYVLNAN